MAVGRVVLCQKLDRVLCQKLDRVLCQTLKWLLTEHSAKYTNGCWQSSTLPNTQMPVGRVVLCQKLDRVLCQTLKWLLTEHSAKYPNGCWQSSTLPKVRQSTLSEAWQSTTLSKARQSTPLSSPNRVLQLTSGLSFGLPGRNHSVCCTQLQL